MEVGRFVAGWTSAFERIEIADGRMLNACIASILLYSYPCREDVKTYFAVNTTLG